ncbi:hypothetical protein QTH47_13275 [Clostridium perfringens]|nr:hypothetical protein [Clostridium perfringens]
MFALIESVGSPEFYTGKTYIYHGAYYPTVSYHKEEAKLYKSEKIALNSCNKLNSKIESGHIFKVIKIN